MRTALRGHENPALDVARAVAERRGVPLHIAAFLLRSHTHPTERRYSFWMQGLRDTQLELRQQVGINFRLYGLFYDSLSIWERSCSSCAG